MSIESVNARISEIQARIRELSPEPWSPPLVTIGSAGSALPAQTALAAPADGVQPFNVALAQANGAATLRPTSELAGGLDGIVGKYSAQYGVDPGVVKAVIKAESDGDPKCVSNKGAMGLMQLMPEEVRGYGVKNPFDPEENVAAGVKQLSDKLKMFNGDLPLALAAYNAGAGAVRKYGGIPPYRETQNYVKKIMGMLGR